MERQNSAREKNPHLAPALTAVLIALAGLAAFGSYARSLELRSIRALAASEAIIARQGQLPPIKNQGIALQQAALETDSLLPVYGSSELNLQAIYNRPFQPTILFRDHPGGFSIFPVGKAETTCLVILQKLAAAGPALNGRKIAISLSPYWFFDRLTARPDAYAGNFSALHAGELVFNTHASVRLKQDAARRMLQFPATVADRPLLKCALENLAGGSTLNLAFFDAILPLGVLHNAILRYQDHWSVVAYLWKHPELTARAVSPRTGDAINWQSLHCQADALYRAHSNNNELGMDNDKWNRELREELVKQKNIVSDEVFLTTLANNREWIDLELLLRELCEFGARPLFLCMPIHGRWYDQCGVTPKSRRAYYQKLRQICARYHTPVIDFADHDADRMFCHDNLGHLAPGGLVHYSEIFASFFHNSMLPQSPLSETVP